MWWLIMWLVLLDKQFGNLLHVDVINILLKDIQYIICRNTGDTISKTAITCWYHSECHGDCPPSTQKLFNVAEVNTKKTNATNQS